MVVLFGMEPVISIDFLFIIELEMILFENINIVIETVVMKTPTEQSRCKTASQSFSAWRSGLASSLFAHQEAQVTKQSQIHKHCQCP